MLRIGITGGLGSGKSTASAIFEMLDVPVYYADVEAKRLMSEDIGLRKAITEKFGEKSFRDGQLDRSYLSGIVFNDPVKLAELNQLVHPVTIEDSEKWMQQKQAEGFPYVIKEAALIFESGSVKQLDHVIGVESPLALRIQRVIERDGLSEKQVMERINRQMDEEEKMKKCDFILINDEKHLLVPQVVKLHQKILALSSGDRSG